MSNARKGADFERRVKAHLESLGYYVVKSGGSKGAADLVACKVGRMTLFVQCKYGGEMRPAEWNALMEAAEKAGAMPIMAKYKRGGADYFRLTGRKSGIRGVKAPMTRIEVKG